MNKFWCFVGLLLALFACTDQKLIVHGSLPNQSFDGEYVFLLPLENYTRQNVDSTKVLNGKFSFTTTPDLSQMYIIRTKPMLRLQLQELLLVNEPGKLNVSLESQSSSEGTPLNDSLQAWKDQKFIFDLMAAHLAEDFKNDDGTNADSLQSKAAFLAHQSANYHFVFIQNNHQNIVGQFVAKVSKHLLTDEQKIEVEQLLN